MSGPSGTSQRIWATTGDVTASAPAAPGGVSGRIRARTSHVVAGLPLAPGGSSGIVRVPGTTGSDLWSFAAFFNETICWPSLPWWSLQPNYYLHGEFLPEHHGVPDGLWVITGTPPSTAAAWFPTNADTTFEMVMQATGRFRIIVWAWLTDANGYSLAGACTFSLLRNGLTVATDAFTETSGSLRVDDLYSEAGDIFIVVYETSVPCPGGGMQGLQVQVDYLGPWI